MSAWSSLGDSVLGLAIATTLYQRYPESEEGDMARVKAFVVSRASCVQVAEQLGVGELILEQAPAARAEAQGGRRQLNGAGERARGIDRRRVSDPRVRADAHRGGGGL